MAAPIMEEIELVGKETGKITCSMRFRYMVPEILFLRGLWKENRGLWWVSFPFHFGLYLMIATFGLLLLHALFVLWGAIILPARAASSNPCLDGLIVLTGWTGLILGSHRQPGASLPTVGRSGTSELFLFLRLFQSSVHPAFLPFRPCHCPVCRSAAGGREGLCLRPADGRSFR